ncbi:ATP-binding protein [uncultured Dokdonia sp.]|uniref:ATP-binding protein n=1 Tax=uncultured Dokdonia sp. TaxID=575653 RepID=UPI00261AC301|nr:ATP-binding protein [uncultured Dokdonia sp.]
MSFYSFMNAQVQDSVIIDSMYKEVERAYNMFDQFDYGEAIKISDQVIDYATKTNNDHLKAKAYNVIGNSYYNTGNIRLCFDYLFKSRDYFLKSGNVGNAIKVTSDIGVTYRELDSISTSNIYFKEAISLGRTSQNKDEIIYPLYNYARHLHNVEKDYDNALVYYSEAYELSKESTLVKGRSILGYLYMRLSDVYFEIDDINNYNFYFNESVSYAKQYDFYGILATLYRTQSERYSQKENYKDAFLALREYTQVADTIYTFRELEIAKEIETKFRNKDNEEKLFLANQEKEQQAIAFKKTRVSNIIFIIVSSILLLAVYAIFNKNKQLKIAKEEAEYLSNVKSKFYSEISHELRTPLYAVIELSRLLLKENVNSSHKEYLESLNFSGNHLLSLINNVLQLNKVEAGKMTLEFLEFRPKNLVLDIIESLEYAISDSHNKVQLAYDATIPEVLVGDSLKLSQILINLISNSIKFTSNGTITIRVKLIETIGDEVTLYFAIEDDGIGISKEGQKKIFEEFYQEHSKTKKSFKGTGLGLSIVKRMLDAMESEIMIDSAEGKGATFSFELKVSKSSKAIIKDEDLKDLTKGLAHKKVLVVDDNKINLLVTKKILDQYDITSQAVDSGEKAINLIKETSFDCILMDIHMPELDGYETTKIIRKNGDQTPIIALTATSTEEIEDKINRQLMDGYILKPFVTSDFIEKIYDTIVEKAETL